MTNRKLVQYMINREVLRTPKIIDAFKVIDRALFVPKRFVEEAYLDYSLPIGDGKVIPQPTCAAIVLELLDPQEGDYVLEIGSGSGWLTALLSELVKDDGYIFAYELNKVVGDFGRRNLAQFDLNNYEYNVLDVKKCWSDNSPYNRIISKLVLTEVEISELTDLLVPGGVMVIPTKEKDIIKITKDYLGNIHERRYSSFVYVPLT